jgi:hypothetical protein
MHSPSWDYRHTVIGEVRWIYPELNATAARRASGRYAF